MSNTTHLTPRPLLFGEVLFDRFPDGSVVLGGAPFNVSWHLQGFGLAPLLISAVGDDPSGEAIHVAMQDWGMDTSGLQVAPYPTSEVQISLDDGEPQFDIFENCAWDHIGREPAHALAEATPVLMLCHGSLALRAAVSRNSLESVRDGLKLPTLVDLNLRDPWWQAGVVSESLTQATWVKLNQDELMVACRSEGLPTADVATMAQNLRARHGLELLVVTQGADGATLVSRDEMVRDQAPKVAGMVDSVGAGDAFTAVLIQGIIDGWLLHQTLRRGLDFAAEVVAQRGAIVKDPELYQRHLERWQNDS